MSSRGPAADAPALLGDLLDVNVWLALAIEEHVHHAAAASYWSRSEGEGMTRYFCRLSAISLVRLLTQPKLMGDNPLPLARAWALYLRFAALPQVAMLSEPRGIDATLDALVKAKLPSRLFTDAYFAALAQSADLRLVTFDKDFERFEDLARLRLSAGNAH